jgi:hypothetical protein
MQIVETVTEFDNMIRIIGDRDVLLYPILTDAKVHPAVNPVCILAVSCDDELYILPFNHNDAVNLDASLLPMLKLTGRVYTPSKKVLMHIDSSKFMSDGIERFPHIIDINSIEYLSTGKVTDSYEFLTPCHKKFYQLYDKQLRVNKSIPMMKHIEMVESYFAHAKQMLGQYDTTDKAFTFINNTAIPALQYLESNGIHVDAELAKPSRYNNDGFLFSEYNPYTTTGRPSNKFGGINFAALNKKDGSRKMFDSRFERGLVVMADYESFHLRLIADMIGYDLPRDIPIHEYLGRQYFDKEMLTEDEYNESKQITFRLLYGEERDDNVPDFFKAVYRYIDALAVLFDHQGYIVSPYSGRKFRRDMIEKPTPSKLFNYMVQLAETEVNLTVINKLKPLFYGKWSVPTLYTYDSILFDYNIDDGPELLKEVIQVLSQDGKFPMRVYFGANYDIVKRLNM